MATRTLDAAPVTSTQVAKGFWSQDLISIRDLTPHDVRAVLDLASLIKARPHDFRAALAGKQMVMFFEKPSLRTRLTFEAGMASLGGTSFFVDQTAARIDAREPLGDVAHNLERWVDIIVLRTFDHATVEGMAANACIPVINALSNLEHPCQALADYFTLQEKFDDLQSIHLAYIGDGNNVANSLLLTCACLGSSIRIATPKGYDPDPHLLAAARKIGRKTGATIEVGHDAQVAVCGADAVYTDTWTSMGREQEAEQRAAIFASYQVNEDMMKLAAPGAVFMHCLPAHRGAEVTAGVMDSPRSVVFDQAESRMHVQKAILLLLLGGGINRFPVRSANA